MLAIGILTLHPFEWNLISEVCVILKCCLELSKESIILAFNAKDDNVIQRIYKLKFDSENIIL